MAVRFLIYIDELATMVSQDVTLQSRKERRDSSLPKYKLTYFVETTLAASENLEFQYCGYTLTFLFGSRVDPRGIEVEVCCESANWREAVVLATDGVIPPILDVIAFHRNTSMLLISTRRVLKAEPNSRQRRAVMLDERLFPTRWFINLAMANEINQILADNIPVPKMALRWLRDSYRAGTIRERFVPAWLALENLAGAKTNEKQCPDCGHKFPSYRSANREAAYKIIREFATGVDETTFDQWWNALRNSVFHGGKEPDSKFLLDLSNATRKIIYAVEKSLANRLNLTFRNRPVGPISRDSVYYRHFYVEFESTNPEEEFAQLVPTLDQLEKSHKGGLAPNVRLLDWKEMNDW